MSVVLCRELGSGGDSGKDGEHVQAATAIDDLLVSLMGEDPDIPVLVVEVGATVEEKQDGFSVAADWPFNASK